MGYHDQCSLIEAPFHGIVELLSKDTRAIERIGTSMRCIWRTESDVGGIVSDCEVEGQIFSRLRVLLLRKAVETYCTKVCCCEWDVWWVQHLDFWSYINVEVAHYESYCPVMEASTSRVDQILSPRLLHDVVDALFLSRAATRLEESVPELVHLKPVERRRPRLCR